MVRGVGVGVVVVGVEGEVWDEGGGEGVLGVVGVGEVGGVGNGEGGGVEGGEGGGWGGDGRGGR